MRGAGVSRMPRVAAQRVLWSVVAAGLVACVGDGPPGKYGDPTVPSDPNALFVVVDSPRDFAQTSEPEVTVEGSARAGMEAPTITFYAGGAQSRVDVVDGRFSARVALAHGENDVRVVGATTSGQRAEVRRRIVYTGERPGVAWLTPVGDAAVGGANVVVRVRVTSGADRSIAQVDIDAGGLASRAGQEPGSAVYVATVPLSASPGEVTLRAVARDSAGAETVSTRVLRRDASPPVVTIGVPTGGQVFATGSIDVGGTASDDIGVTRVTLAVDEGEPEPATGTTTWSGRLSMDPGVHKITARAYDASGQLGTATVQIEVSRIVTLRPPSDSGDVTMSLDTAGLARLIPEADQRRLTMLYVDLAPLLASGLAAIKNPAAFGIDTSTWGAAERNMQRLLLMSPDNADLRGTGLEEVLTLAPNLGLPPARLLSDIGGVAVDAPFLVESEVSDAIIRNLIESHPNIDTDPADGKKKVRATLYDALRDFTTLGPKFGPAGGHPGFLVGSTFARALRANFKMTVTARSNLVQHDGVNPETGKAFLFVARNPANPEILDFDFLSEERFKVEGLADQPAVDMTFFMTESPQYFPATHNQTARPDGLFFKGSNGAWDISPWFLERVVLDGVYQSKRARFMETMYRKEYRYDVGAIRPAATIAWDKGWVSATTAGGLGNPPRPAYFWDHLLEAAQKRLHDQGVAEGQGRVQFALRGIPLGLTGAQLKEKLRPQMEAQKADLSRIILGDRSSYRANAAFYLAKGADNAEYLYFTAPGDVPGASPYPYATPGFFRDQALADKASSTSAGSSGDTVHEKVAASAPATYFMRGADRKTYRLELIDRTAAGLRVRVVPAGN